MGILLTKSPSPLTTSVLTHFYTSHQRSSEATNYIGGPNDRRRQEQRATGHHYSNAKLTTNRVSTDSTVLYSQPPKKYRGLLSVNSRVAKLTRNPPYDIISSWPRRLPLHAKLKKRSPKKHYNDSSPAASVMYPTRKAKRRLDSCSKTSTALPPGKI